MKKLFFSMSIVALVLSSCGDASGDASVESNDSKPSSAVCDCIDGQVNMMKDMLNGMSESDAEAKYGEMMAKCEKMGEGKSDSELEALQKEAEACPSMKEIEKLQKEVKEKMMSDARSEEGLNDMELEMDME